EMFVQRRDIFSPTTRGGEEVRLGNDPGIVPGPECCYTSYGRPWANVSNTPFRMYKKWTHEGGIAAPFILHWPGGGLEEGKRHRSPLQLDRKSTRLNSSHVSISYAVFCLKKKKS